MENFAVPPPFWNEGKRISGPTANLHLTERLLYKGCGYFAVYAAIWPDLLRYSGEMVKISCFTGNRLYEGRTARIEAPAARSVEEAS